MEFKNFYELQIYLCVFLLLFVPDRPCQPSLLFANKAGAYMSRTPIRRSTLG
jgi:hypothetical protein